jgi:hypothetical protein
VICGAVEAAGTGVGKPGDVPGSGGGFGAMTGAGADTLGGTGGGAMGAFDIAGAETTGGEIGGREAVCGGGATAAGDLTGGIE